MPLWSAKPGHRAQPVRKVTRVLLARMVPRGRKALLATLVHKVFKEKPGQRALTARLDQMVRASRLAARPARYLLRHRPLTLTRHGLMRLAAVAVRLALLARMARQHTRLPLRMALSVTRLHGLRLLWGRRARLARRVRRGYKEFKGKQDPLVLTVLQARLVQRDRKAPKGYRVTPGRQVPPAHRASKEYRVFKAQPVRKVIRASLFRPSRQHRHRSTICG